MHRNIPVRHEDLPAVEHLSQRDSAVLAPVVQSLSVIDEDDKVVDLALVEDAGLLLICARHCG